VTKHIIHPRTILFFYTNDLKSDKSAIKEDENLD